MLQRDEVIATYQLLLGRDPESEAVIDLLRGSVDLQVLGRTLLGSVEFRRRAALGILPPGEHRWACVEIRHGLRLWLDLLDVGVGAGALQDNWEPDETNFVLGHLETGDTFLDIGANIGWFTILGAERVGPTGLVHAFEPRSDLFLRLTDSVHANGFQDRCVLHKLALGEGPGVMRIAHVPAERNPGHSFLLPAGGDEAYVELGSVPVERLDSLKLRRPPKLIKVDTEGAEMLVLRGASALLAAHSPMILTEFFPLWLRRVSGVDPADYLRLLWDHGYRLFHLGSAGATEEITDVPAVKGDPSEFYLNIVAAKGPKIVPVATLPPATAFRRGSQVVDDNLPRLRENLAEIARESDRWRLETSRLEWQVAEATRREQARAEQHERELASLASREAAAREAQARQHAEELAEIARESDRWRLETSRLEWQVAEATRREQARAEQHERELASLASREAAAREAQARQHAEELAERSARTADAERRSHEAEETLRAERNNLQELRAHLDHAEAQLRAMISSTTHQVMQPVRKVGAMVPARMRRFLRRGLRVCWWAATLQLSKRLEERRRLIDGAPPAAAFRIDDMLPAATSGRLALHERAGPAVLIIDDRWPEPDRDSGSLDAINLIGSMVAFGYHTMVAKCTTHPQDPRYVRLVRELGATPVEAEGAAAVQAFIERHGQEFALFVLTRMGAGGQFLELIRFNVREARIIFNTVDLHFLRESRAARLSGDAAALSRADRTRDREEFLTARSDLTIVVSEAERDILSHAVPGASLLHLPLARQVHWPDITCERRSGIGFVGGFAHMPNIDAVRYFLAEIWPHVHAALPGLRFDIVGAGLPAEVLDGVPGDVRYLGAIDDLDAWLNGLRLSIAPLRIGAGAKGKVASSLCAGLPCVASPVAAEGMGLTPGENILVAEMPVAFAAEVVRLHEDPALWQRISLGAGRFAEETLSVRRFRGRLRRALVGLNLPVMAEDEASARRVTVATPAAPPAPPRVQPGIVYSCRDRAGYDAYVTRHRRLIARIAAHEDSRPDDASYMERGRCAVCGQEQDFLVDFQFGHTDASGRRRRNWRERLECQGCHLNNRMRAVVQLMLGNLGAASGGGVYLTEQVTPLFKAFKSRLPNLVGSEFLRDGTPRGEVNTDGIRHEDLTALSFGDEAFRYIGSFDVLEHVPDYRRGLAELARCLEPGGALLLSTPFFPHYDRTLIRAVVSAAGTIEHLAEPEFHGDPLSPEGALCFYHFGWSLLDDLRAAGFRDPRILLYWTRRYGHLGGLQPIILAHKVTA
jgi:FkbM family methyltransferase